MACSRWTSSTHALGRSLADSSMAPSTRIMAGPQRRSTAGLVTGGCRNACTVSRANASGGMENTCTIIVVWSTHAWSNCQRTMSRPGIPLTSAGSPWLAPTTLPCAATMASTRRRDAAGKAGAASGCRSGPSASSASSCQAACLCPPAQSHAHHIIRQLNSGTHRPHHVLRRPPTRAA